MEQVTIVVDPNGGTEVSVQCVKGKKCQDVTREIEKALGRTTKDAPTSEMREVAHVQAGR
jgi:hypothetical protein